MKKIALLLFVLFFVVGCDQRITLQFETDGGSTIDPIDITVDQMPDEPEAPTKEGYRFGGWYLDSDFDTPYAFDEVLTEDTTLYAKWDELAYRIVFEDFDESIIFEISFEVGTDLSDFDYPNNPSREGYLFLGWYNMIPDTMPAEDVVLKAVYQEMLGYQIALVVGPEGVNDEGMNAMTWEAVQAFAEGNTISFRYYQATEYSLDALTDIIELAIINGAEIVICPGFLFDVAVFELQSIYSDVAFLLLDGYPHDDNYQNFYATENTVAVSFREEQAGFLAGYAAVMEGYRSLGFLGGMPVPAVVEYGQGFIQGAEYAGHQLGLNAGDIIINYHYAGQFEASAGLTALMSEWYDAGTEVIFSVSGQGIFSVLEAAEMHEGAMVIEPDTTTYLGNELILTSAIKRFDNATFLALTDFYDHQKNWPSFYAGHYLEMGAENDGIGLATIGIYWRFEEITEQDLRDVMFDMATGNINIIVDNSEWPNTDIVQLMILY